ncbi:MAG: DUF3604 domain-containing protein [Candidatus Binatia bacterium]
MPVTSGAPRARPAEQILFGDLHVHTAKSFDAFITALPISRNTGLHPIADACDFARFCSNLDFFAITDHAEALTNDMWRQSIAEMGQCQAVAGPPADPDLVVFPGWEWTQMAETEAKYYGHKNVIFRDLDPKRLPPRPISSRQPPGPDQEWPDFAGIAGTALRDPLHASGYLRLLSWMVHLGWGDFCPSGVDSRALSRDCLEAAPDPQTLFEKLGQWGFDVLVIPHGTGWGLMVPPGAHWENQLDRLNHDVERQRLIEVYSGHGNNEEYRDYRPEERQGTTPVCPQPRPDYLPCCWRAGELAHERCAQPGTPACEAAVERARAAFLAAGLYGDETIPDARPEDWLDCGQCRDCYNPAFSLRPRATVQYALALTNFDDPRHPLRYRFGLLASSDDHRAQPGTGYKEIRQGFTDDDRGSAFRWLFGVDKGTPTSKVRRSPAFWEYERQNSFFYASGLAAVHVRGRGRRAIWEALERRDVYGTSGARILLWFNLLSAKGRRLPMGSEVSLDTNPTFEVHAIGGFKQQPGCPADTAASAPPGLLTRLCYGECYNPSDQRLPIERIEVVRIRPQIRPGEPVGPLIEDPWKVLPCARGQEACTVRFTDPDFARDRRDTVYYVRALQSPTMQVNAAGLRCTRDERGACVSVRLCREESDNCAAPARERAWSSPIFVDFAAAAPPQ